MITKQQAIAVLEPHRPLNQHLMADIEAAINAIDENGNHILFGKFENDIIFLETVAGLSPNLHHFLVNNRRGDETIEFAEEFQNLAFKAHHVDRLITELNKLPVLAPFVQLQHLVLQVIDWANADLAIGQPPRPRGLLSLFGG